MNRTSYCDIYTSSVNMCALLCSFKRALYLVSCLTGRLDDDQCDVDQHRTLHKVGDSSSEEAAHFYIPYERYLDFSSERSGEHGTTVS